MPLNLSLINININAAPSPALSLSSDAKYGLESAIRGISTTDANRGDAPGTVSSIDAFLAGFGTNDAASDGEADQGDGDGGLPQTSALLGGDTLPGESAGGEPGLPPAPPPPLPGPGEGVAPLGPGAGVPAPQVTPLPQPEPQLVAPVPEGLPGPAAGESAAIKPSPTPPPVLKPGPSSSSSFSSIFGGRGHGGGGGFGLPGSGPGLGTAFAGGFSAGVTAHSIFDDNSSVGWSDPGDHRESKGQPPAYELPPSTDTTGPDPVRRVYGPERPELPPSIGSPAWVQAQRPVFGPEPPDFKADMIARWKELATNTSEASWRGMGAEREVQGDIIFLQNAIYETERLLAGNIQHALTDKLRLAGNLTTISAVYARMARYQNRIDAYETAQSKLAIAKAQSGEAEAVLKHALADMNGSNDQALIDRLTSIAAEQGDVMTRQNLIARTQEAIIDDVRGSIPDFRNRVIKSGALINRMEEANRVLRAEIADHRAEVDTLSKYIAQLDLAKDHRLMDILDFNKVYDRYSQTEDSIWKILNGLGITREGEDDYEEDEDDDGSGDGGSHMSVVKLALQDPTQPSRITEASNENPSPPTPRTDALSAHPNGGASLLNAAGPAGAATQLSNPSPAVHDPALLREAVQALALHAAIQDPPADEGGAASQNLIVIGAASNVSINTTL